MAKTIKRGNLTLWIDGSGLEIPEKYIRDADKARDKLVTNLIARARRLSQIIASEKQLISGQIAAYLSSVAQAQGEEWSGGTTLYNFSMDQAIVVKIAKRWTFDEKLSIAKQKIDECIRIWSPGSNDKLVALVNRAFDVDSKGEVDAKQIIGLRQLNFEDPLWTEAMDLIADSQKVQSTKTYFYFQEADDDGKLKSIVMDFAAL